MQPALQLALLLAILLPAGKVAASLCTRFGLPAILGELSVGVVLGPGAFNLLHLRLFADGQASGALLMLAQVGGLVLMFIAGLETDVERMRQSSMAAFLVAVSGVVFPFALGAVACHWLGLSWQTACFIGGALTATSVSISARTLMDAGQMASQEASVILGAAVIDDVIGLLVLAILAASGSTVSGATFGLAPTASAWIQHRLGPAANHPLLIQMTVISMCVLVFFAAGYGMASRWLDPCIRQLRKLTAAEAVPSCILALVLVYAISAEWLGSVAGITGAYVLGFVFAESEFKAEVERSFAAIGHALLIPLFFVAIGLSSDYRALTGHWGLLSLVLIAAIIGKLAGCGLAARASGMSWVASLRIGSGMVSRGEVGLIVTAMGATLGIFGRIEVAVMVAVVLLTTLVTPLALRWTFSLPEQADPSTPSAFPEAVLATGSVGIPSTLEWADARELAVDTNYPMALNGGGQMLAFSEAEPLSE